MLIVSIYIVGSFLTPTFCIEPTKYMKSKNPFSMRTDQLVEKVQHLLGFLLFLWYNKSGDENVGKES